MLPQVKRMRRLIYLLLLVLFVSASATCVSASTDCERWFVAYRQELAHTRSVQRIAAAKRRAKLYAQRKLAGYIPPKPKPKVVLASAPRMTRKQTLHHFDLACGVLPEETADAPVIAEEAPAPFDGNPVSDGIDLLPATPGQMIAENNVPPPPTNDQPPSYSSGGGPPIYIPPFTGGITPPSGSPGTGTTTNTTPPNGGPPASGPPTSGPPSSGPPTSGPPGGGPPTGTPPVVPEPSTYILMLTGMAGTAGAVRNRFKS
jgi:hypothetical protein